MTTCLGKDGGAEVDDAVDAGELLQQEDHAPNEDALVRQQLLHADCCRVPLLPRPPHLQPHHPYRISSLYSNFFTFMGLLVLSPIRLTTAASEVPCHSAALALRTSAAPF